MMARILFMALPCMFVAGGASSQIQVPPGYRVATTLAASTFGVPGPIGGIDFTTDGTILFVTGGASYSTAGIWVVPVHRDPITHRIQGFGPSRRAAYAPEADGGLQQGPRMTFFFTRYSVNHLGQIVGTTPFTAALPSTTQSVGGLTFVPKGLPNAGDLLVSSYEKGDIFTVSLIDHGTGTFTPSKVSLFATLPPGTEGFRYIPTGSGAGAILFSNYDNKPASVLRMDIDPKTGQPAGGVNTPRLSTFVTGIAGAEGMAFDPLTSDLVISTWQGTPGDSLVHITGFPPPPFSLEASSTTVSYLGGQVNLTLGAGGHNAGRGYLILGSVSGTSPGFVVNGVPVPLNLDRFSVAVVTLVNTHLFSRFSGTTDAKGNATGILNIPKLTLATVGLKVFFAGALVGPLTAASRPVTLTITG